MNEELFYDYLINNGLKIRSKYIKNNEIKKDIKNYINNCINNLIKLSKDNIDFNKNNFEIEIINMVKFNMNILINNMINIYSINDNSNYISDKVKYNIYLFILNKLISEILVIIFSI